AGPLAFLHGDYHGSCFRRAELDYRDGLLRTHRGLESARIALAKALRRIERTWDDEIESLRAHQLRQKMSQNHNYLQRRFIVSIFALVVLIGAALLLGGLLAPTANKPLNVGGFCQIKVGMSLSEVEGLLGGPPGNYGRYAEGTSEMTLEGY